MKSTLRKASWVAKVFSPAIWVMALWVVLGGGGQPAYATHFRYGHVNWTSLSGNTVQFTVQNAFRRSFVPSTAFECLDPATLATIPCSAADGHAILAGRWHCNRLSPRYALVRGHVY